MLGRMKKYLDMMELESQMRKWFAKWKHHERIANENRAKYEQTRQEYERIASR